MSAKNNSINEMSEQFLQEKAHVVENNKIELLIKDVDVYPSSKNQQYFFIVVFHLMVILFV